LTDNSNNLILDIDMAKKAKKSVRKTVKKTTRRVSASRVSSKVSSSNNNLLLLALALLVVVIAAYMMTMSSFSTKPLATMTPAAVQSPTPKAPVKTMAPLKK